MTIQQRIEELASDLKKSTGKRPRRILLSEMTFRQWATEMESASGVEAGSFAELQMSAVKAHAGGCQLEFAASDRELEVE